jgi:hypothetical protein
MAGEWIKMRVDLASDPAVIRIRRATGIDADAVVGKLHRLWAWADTHTAEGAAEGLDVEWVDEFAGVKGFAAAMQLAGWLEVDDAGLRFTNFDRHNGQPAKVRALAKTRMLRNRCATSATVAQPEEEKRREEEEEEVATTVPPQERRKRSQPTDGLRWSPADGWQGIEDVDRTEWAAAFPACDLAVELAKAHAWCKGNPAKAHKSNWRAFLVRWLNTAQNSGGTHRTAGNRTGTGPPPTPPERKRFYRADAAKNLTDDEYRAWRAGQRPAAQLKEVS